MFKIEGLESHVRIHTKSMVSRRLPEEKPVVQELSICMYIYIYIYICVRINNNYYNHNNKPPGSGRNFKT